MGKIIGAVQNFFSKWRRGVSCLRNLIFEKVPSG